jgi:hypothetical protein
MYQSAWADEIPNQDNKILGGEILDLEPDRILNEGREPKGIYLNNDLAWLATVEFCDVDIFTKTCATPCMGFVARWRQSTPLTPFAKKTEVATIARRPCIARCWGPFPYPGPLADLRSI